MFQGWRVGLQNRRARFDSLGGRHNTEGCRRGPTALFRKQMVIQYDTSVRLALLPPDNLAVAQLESAAARRVYCARPPCCAEVSPERRATNAQAMGSTPVSEARQNGRLTERFKVPDC